MEVVAGRKGVQCAIHGVHVALSFHAWFVGARSAWFYKLCTLTFSISDVKLLWHAQFGFDICAYLCKCVVTCHSVVRSFFIYGKLWLYFAVLCQDAASATRVLGNTSGIAGLLSLVAARLHLPFLSLKVRRTTFLQSPGQPSWGETLWLHRLDAAKVAFAIICKCFIRQNQW